MIYGLLLLAMQPGMDVSRLSSVTATLLAPECAATWNASQPQSEYWSLKTMPSSQYVHWGATTTSPITAVADVFHGVLVIGNRLAATPWAGWTAPMQCGCGISPTWDLLLPIWNDNITTVAVDIPVPVGWQPLSSMYAQPAFFRHPHSSLDKYGNCGVLGVSVGKLWHVVIR